MRLMKVQDEKAANLRQAVQGIIDQILYHNVGELITSLRDPSLVWLAEQLHSAKQSPDLIRELFRRWVMKPDDENDPRVASAREYLGWNTEATDFDPLKPEFLDVIYLLPPRNYALLETLVPVLERQIEVIKQGEDIEIKTLFDIGTGTGLLIQLLREAGLTGEMVGIEPAPSLASYASKRFDKSGVQILIEKIQDYQANQRFHIAICYMVLHHLNDAHYDRALRSIFRTLAEGGLFVYTDKMCLDTNAKNEPQPFDFTTAAVTLTLDSGQEFDVQSAELNSVVPFQPHPPLVEEYQRTLKTAAEKLSETGFLIQSTKPLNKWVMLFVCRKPHAQIWIDFAQEPNPAFAEALVTAVQMTRVEGKSPYNWTSEVLRALYKDITTEECPAKKEDTKFLKGIAYFSWEKASRLFLVRRAVPFDFHILSYSHVHDGWGTLGRMVEEFENDTNKYVEDIGYSCLTRDAVQRTLPFQGDIDYLNYQAAMAVPIYKVSELGGYQLRGAFLLYLAKPEYVPIHTGSQWQKNLVKKFKKLNHLMNEALNEQEISLAIEDSSTIICDKWKKLAKERPDLVIARLEIRIKMPQQKVANAYLGLLKVCSNVQALLSGSKFFSVLDDRDIKKGKATILVAAKYRTSYDEIRESILTAVGSVAESYRPLYYQCTDLGKE
jgi:ubiquinone/menaquinone biosynthesis C-methylase UbiE